MRLICGIDLESTGLDVREDRIVEIAILVYDLDTRQRKLSYVRRVNPAGKRMDPKAQAVHGIDPDTLIGLPTFPMLAGEVMKVLRLPKLCIAHNGFDFDMPMLAHELMRAGETVPRMELDDTVRATWATADGKRPKLSELAWSLNVGYDASKAHAAEYDVEVMMQCWFAGLDKGFFVLPESLR